MREWRPKHSELEVEQRMRANARSMANTYHRRGKLTPAPACESCGCSGKLEKHHEDYSKPLIVVWLCRPCHLKKHK